MHLNVRNAIGAVIALVCAACGGPRAPIVTLPGTGPEPNRTQPTTPGLPTIGWQFFAAEHTSLWYHSLALVGLGVTGATAGPVPLYRPRYLDEVATARRRIGGTSTLAQRALEFERTFAANPNDYSGLQFLPLYFQDSQQIFAAVDVWDRAQGDPRRASSQDAQRGMALLASMFPGNAQRQTVVDFTRAVQDEQRAFFHAYWQEQQPRLSQLAVSARAEWNGLLPQVTRFIEYAQLHGGEVFLTPALAGEGRSVTQGVDVPRFAIGVPATAQEVTFELLHELIYAVAGDLIKDNIAPADVRTIGQEVLSARVAVRGAAILVARAAPGRVGAFERFYLQQAGRTPPSSVAALQAAFEQTFPLSDGLRQALEREIQSAFAGI
jgi:hypothetical protein